MRDTVSAGGACRPSPFAGQDAVPFGVALPLSHSCRGNDHACAGQGAEGLEGLAITFSGALADPGREGWAWRQSGVGKNGKRGGKGREGEGMGGNGGGGVSGWKRVGRCAIRTAPYCGRSPCREEE